MAERAKRKNPGSFDKVDIGQNSKKNRNKIRQALRSYVIGEEIDDEELYDDEYLKKTLNPKEKLN